MPASATAVVRPPPPPPSAPVEITETELMIGPEDDLLTSIQQNSGKILHLAPGEYELDAKDEGALSGVKLVGMGNAVVNVRSAVEFGGSSTLLIGLTIRVYAGGVTCSATSATLRYCTFENESGIVIDLLTCSGANTALHACEFTQDVNSSVIFTGSATCRSGFTAGIVIVESEFESTCGICDVNALDIRDSGSATIERLIVRTVVAYPAVYVTAVANSNPVRQVAIGEMYVDRSAGCVFPHAIRGSGVVFNFEVVVEANNTSGKVEVNVGSARFDDDDGGAFTLTNITAGGFNVRRTLSLPPPP